MSSDSPETLSEHLDSLALFDLHGDILQEITHNNDAPPLRRIAAAMMEMAVRQDAALFPEHQPVYHGGKV